MASAELAPTGNDLSVSGGHIAVSSTQAWWVEVAQSLQVPVQPYSDSLGLMEGSVCSAGCPAEPEQGDTFLSLLCAVTGPL